MKPPEFLIQDSRNIMMSLQITKLSKKYFINFFIIRYTVMGMGILNPELLGLGTSLIFKYINNLKRKKKYIYIYIYIYIPSQQVHQQVEDPKHIQHILLFNSQCASHYQLAFSNSAVTHSSPPHLLAACNLCSF